MASIFGHFYSFETKDDFEERFNNTIWITYREIDGSGDVGWGCMIRVVQMVFAEIFKRHLSKASVKDVIKIFK